MAKAEEDVHDGITPGQQAALDALVSEFGIRHSRQFTICLTVRNGIWELAEINPQKRVMRVSGRVRHSG